MLLFDLDGNVRRQRRSRADRIGTLMAVFSWLAAGAAVAQSDLSGCGSLDNAFGPWDYTNPLHVQQQPGQNESHLSIVERAHFTPVVESLQSGQRGGPPLKDLEYTLRAFPNHHRALYSMAKYHLRNGLKPIGLYSMDCWFQRAIRFKPNDPNVRIVYGIFLVKKGDKDGALIQYRTALEINNRLPEAHYNIGLLYADLEDYELAYEHAVQAYKLGHPMSGLRRRLVSAGAWKDDSQGRQ